jgi:hypothetical protein
VRITQHVPLPCHRPEGLAGSLTLHLAVLVVALNIPRALEHTPRSSGSALTLTYVAPEAITSPPRPQGAPVRKGEAIFTEQDAGGSGIAEDAGTELPELAFNFERVRTAKNDLFPFLTWDLVFLRELQEKVRQDEAKLHNPLGQPRRQPSSEPPLVMSPPQLQQMIDQAWSRRERWKNFAHIANLIDAHDPDQGQLPALIHGYLDQNLLQPYFDSSRRDPRYWAMLGLASDHARIVEFVGRFVREHPSSRTTTELLFMLDEFVQASLDTLLMVLSTDPETQLLQTREASSDAFNLAVSIRRGYEAWLEARTLNRPAALRQKFDDIRLSVLSLIVSTTPNGYGSADARFLAGRILWERNDTAGAARLWGAMTADGRGSYRVAIESTLAAREADGTFDVIQIQRVLGAEYRRWITESEQRLAHFGFAIDTF